MRIAEKLPQSQILTNHGGGVSGAPPILFFRPRVPPPSPLPTAIPACGQDRLSGYSGNKESGANPPAASSVGHIYRPSSRGPCPTDLGSAALPSDHTCAHFCPQPTPPPRVLSECWFFYRGKGGRGSRPSPLLPPQSCGGVRGPSHRTYVFIICFCQFSHLLNPSEIFFAAFRR